MIRDYEYTTYRIDERIEKRTNTSKLRPAELSVRVCSRPMSPTAREYIEKII